MFPNNSRHTVKPSNQPNNHLFGFKQRYLRRLAMKSVQKRMRQIAYNIINLEINYISFMTQSL